VFVVVVGDELPQAAAASTAQPTQSAASARTAAIVVVDERVTLPVVLGP